MNSSKDSFVALIQVLFMKSGKYKAILLRNGSGIWQECLINGKTVSSDVTCYTIENVLAENREEISKNFFFVLRADLCIEKTETHGFPLGKLQISDLKSNAKLQDF
jgi:hypothetical protein